MIKKSDVTIPIIPGETEQSVERPTAIEHASMPTTAIKAIIRALVLTLPSLILFQIPPQKLEQQPGSDIDASLDQEKLSITKRNQIFSKEIPSPKRCARCPSPFESRNTHRVGAVTAAVTAQHPQGKASNSQTTHSLAVLGFGSFVQGHG